MSEANPQRMVGYQPGVIADVIRLHMDYYAPEWGFGIGFETKLAREMREFHGRFDPARDLFLAAVDENDRVVGSITVDGVNAGTTGAHVRWFIVGSSARGSGLGKELMRRAVEFVDARGYRRTELTTFKGLDAARALYERHGFTLAHEDARDDWSGSVGTQHFERIAG